MPLNTQLGPVRARALAVGVPGAVALVLALWHLDRGTMWRDEAATVMVASRSLPQLWHVLGTVDAVHGLYYLLMHFVLPLHPGEFTLRLPSVAGAAATACLVAALGTRLVRPRVGLWAGLLYAVSPFTQYYAQEGRSYALVAAGAAGATLLLVRCVDRPTARAWAGYAAAVTVTAWLHEFAVLLLAAHAVTLAVTRAPARVWRGWGTAAGCAALLLLPLAVVARGQSGQVAWIRRPGWADAETLLRAATGHDGLLYAATLALIAVALLRPPARRAPGACGLVATALPLALVPPLVLLAVSQWHPLYAARYALFAFAGVPLLVAAGAGTLLSRVPRLVPGAATPALAGAGLVAAAFLAQLPLQEHQRSADARRDDLGAVARLLAAHLRPGDPLLYLPKTGRRYVEAYPASVAGVRDVSLRTSGAASGTLYGLDVGPRELAARMACLPRVSVLYDAEASRPGWHTRSTGERAKLAVLRRDFVPLGEARRRSGLLVLYARVGGPAPGC
ncbi:glycosyltransferase family 39 protein [Streptomyces longispororuber]|uniref:glycosyltransferase family 39 protein n=1 Tax=Streptomyces longispororuber TaxID=68230 RepID=UPI00210DAEA0|nr:glycosyltransferase family 39 protein [Streptomyces longispororuber]MCQ4213042.1 glycosyltransferase family 39 protein [Streptomyces longispororuber]